MKLTLFSRLILGYLAIFVLVAGLSVHAISQLGRLDEVARSILESDTRLLEQEKRLADALLSQIRYERQFILTKDDRLYEQFLLRQSDFENYLDQAYSFSNPQAKSLLDGIRASYQRYRGLVDEEVRYLRAGRSFSQARYRQETEKAADGIMEKLEGLRAYSQESSYGKIRALSEAGAEARRVAIVIAGTSLFLVVAVSLWITRTITRPISILKRKTREIAEGRFEGEVRFSSPPEIAALAGDFNAMCLRLKDLDKMKLDFFSSMSHELRTPLTSIKEGTGLLLEGVGQQTIEKQRKILTILAEESDRLIHLVNSLLDLSKMEAGMMAYHFERASLAPLILRTVDEIGPLVEAKKIRLEASADEELPPVKMDSEKILQALRNLVGNAVKFTPAGGRVTVSARERKGGVEVSVRDSGPGIPAEDLPSIFDKYRQGASSALRVKGTGLGLAIVKSIISSHGGKVWAESKPGQGSTFIFVLPS